MIDAMLWAIACVLLAIGAAAGWIARGDMPHVAARCRTDRHIEFVTEGDHVVVRCAP
jgi:hypothetical protein